MDRDQEEMQLLGLFGIFRESFKIIHSWRKIFGQISLAFILPLSFLILLHIDLSVILRSKISHDKAALGHSYHRTTRLYHNLSDVLSRERAEFILTYAAYFIFLLVLSLLSTSAVVYTVASIYTGREVTFKKVLGVVPRVWKRLIVTFLCIFAAVFLYYLLTAVLLVGTVMTVVLMGGDITAISAVLSFVGILQLAGLVYMSVVWYLASVISVLEEDYGFRAMAKSKDLIKGKLIVSVISYCILHFFMWLTKALFGMLVTRGGSTGIPAKIGFGVLCLVLLSGFILLWLTVQTVIYFVCKSYHHQNIDKSILSDRLDVYVWDYVPLMAKDVQLEQCQV